MPATVERATDQRGSSRRRDPDAEPEIAEPEVVEEIAPRPERRFRPSRLRTDDLGAVAACMVAALALTWLEYGRLLPLSGVVGFWVTWYAVFLPLHTLLAWLRTRDRVAAVDQLVSALVWGAGVLVVGALALVIGYTASRGWPALRTNFFTETMLTTGPLEPLSRGGALHAMVGTLQQVGLGILFSVPLGIATGLYLNEVGGRLARVVRTVVDAMSALPSIVAGLFVFAVVILTFRQEKSGFAAALALSVMMMPIITRTSEVVFRLVPGGLREASAALGAPQWRTVLFVVLPTARSSLVTAVILGVARGVGETAPVLLTAGFTGGLTLNPFGGQQVSLPLYIFNYVRFPQPEMITRAYGAALMLLLLVCTLFVLARIIGGNGPGSLSRRQQRRLARSTR